MEVITSLGNFIVDIGIIAVTTTTGAIAWLIAHFANR